MRLPALGDRGQGWVWIQSLIMTAIPTVGSLAPTWPPPARIPLVVAGGVVVALGCALLVVAIVGLGNSFASSSAQRPPALWSLPAFTLGPGTRSTAAGSLLASASRSHYLPGLFR